MKKKKSIEERYVKLSDIEHVLLRPGRYIGSVTPHTDTTHVVTDEGQIVKEKITWNQGLIKLFDEVISNSVDESKRKGSKLDTIKVKLDESNGKITVWDNGGIPVEIHKEENMYVPELIFGELKAGSNFDDSEEAFLTGQNGEGSSLTNIFSSMFKVETCDGKNKFTQIFRKNSTDRSTPKIEKSTTSFTRITFTPDYERLTTEMSGGNYKKLVKRVYDIAGCNPNLKVYLNAKQIRIKSFKDYISLYTPSYIYEENKEWKVAVAQTESGFEQISFVNGTEAMDTNSTHISYIANQIIVKLREFFKKKHKVDVKPSDIKNHIRLFIDATIMNPRYSSQTKEKLITEVKDYGTEITISDRFINKLLKSDVIQDILDWVEAKKQAQERAELRKLNKNISKANLRHIVKLSDANEKNDRTKCMLMLAEGDSAAKHVKSKGDKRYIGSYPLKGKPLNVKDIPVKKVMLNEELKNIMLIMGLEIGVPVESVEQLRYGKIVMMVDADTDGSHICGLLLNFFNEFWPELFELGILYRFVTPIVTVKVTGAKGEMAFNRLSDYYQWIEENPETKYTSVYYKGLGTSTSKQFKKYLDNIDDHLIQFNISDKKDLDLIDLAFNKKRADDRKKWLGLEGNVDAILEEFVAEDSILGQIDLKEFFARDLKEFSLDNAKRAIPSMIDGLKESQRKIVYGLSTKGNISRIKVAQLGAVVSEKTDYHHGEVSLENAIVGLAQDFTGSNNLNLLEPLGSFGSRLSPEASASRYIFTRFSSTFRDIFKKEDDSILEHHFSDDMKIEPTHYLPLLPMVLVNGCVGIGTGFASKILSYSPKDIRTNILNILNGRRMKSITPWYKNFTGDISNNEDGYSLSGKLEIVNTTTIKITELPVGTYLDQYKAHLIKLENSGFIKEFEDNSTEDGFDFLIKCPRTTTSMSMEKLYGNSGFKLLSKGKENITVWDAHGKIQRYVNANALIKDFVEFRLDKYEVRRLRQIEILTEELKWLVEKLKFIKYYLDNSTSFSRRGKDSLFQMLKKEGFKQIDRLLSLRIYTLTKDEIVKLKTSIKSVNAEIKELKKLTAKDIYIEELKKLKF